MTFHYFLCYIYIGFCLQGTSQCNCGRFLAPFSFPFPSLPSTAPFKSACLFPPVFSSSRRRYDRAEPCQIEGYASQRFQVQQIAIQND